VKISCLVAAYGEPRWQQLAMERARPSAASQGFDEVITHYERDATLATVRNEAAAQAKGDWLLFLDADDELELGFGDAMRAAAVGHDAYTLFTPSVRYQRPGRSQPHTRIWPRMDIRRGNWLIIGTLISKRVFKEVGGFREYGWSEDWALFAGAINLGCEVVEVPGAVYRAWVNLKSRNRSAHRLEMLYWHAAIGHDLWPDIYESPTVEEHHLRRLTTSHVRCTLP